MDRLSTASFNLPNSPGGRDLYGPMLEMWDQRLREVEGLEAAEPGAWAAPPWEPSPSPALGGVVYHKPLPRDRRGGPGEAGA